MHYQQFNNTLLTLNIFITTNIQIFSVLKLFCNMLVILQFFIDEHIVSLIMIRILRMTY